MKNRNIPYYVAALMLAAGVSTSFVSCVDTDEPSSIEELRKAKANEVNAQAAYKNALAQTQLQTAEIQKQKAAQEAIATQMKEIDRQIKESGAAVAKAQNELEVLKAENGKVHEKAIAAIVEVKDARWLTAEKARAIDTALIYDARVAEKEAELKQLKDKAEADLASAAARLQKQINDTKRYLNSLQLENIKRTDDQTDSLLIQKAAHDEVAANLLSVKTAAEGLLTKTFDAWVQAKLNVLKAQSNLTEAQYDATVVSNSGDNGEIALQYAEKGVENTKLATAAAEKNLADFQALKENKDYTAWIDAYGKADKYITEDLAKRTIERKKTLAEKKNAKTAAENAETKAKETYEDFAKPQKEAREAYNETPNFYKYDLKDANNTYANLIDYIAKGADDNSDWKNKLNAPYTITKGGDDNVKKSFRFNNSVSGVFFVSQELVNGEAVEKPITNKNYAEKVAVLYKDGKDGDESVIGQFIARTKSDTKAKEDAEKVLADLSKKVMGSDGKGINSTDKEEPLIKVWDATKTVYSRAVTDFNAAKKKKEDADKGSDAAVKEVATKDYNKAAIDLVSAYTKFVDANKKLFGDNYADQADYVKANEEAPESFSYVEESVNKDASGYKTAKFIMELPKAKETKTTDNVYDENKFGVYAQYLKALELTVPEWTRKVKADAEAAKFVKEVKAQATGQSITETLDAITKKQDELNVAVMTALNSDEAKKALADWQTKKAAKTAAEDEVKMYSEYYKYKKEDNKEVRDGVAEAKAVVDKAIQDEIDAQEELKKLYKTLIENLYNDTYTPGKDESALTYDPKKYAEAYSTAEIKLKEAVEKAKDAQAIAEAKLTAAQKGEKYVAAGTVTFKIMSVSGEQKEVEVTVKDKDGKESKVKVLQWSYTVNGTEKTITTTTNEDYIEALKTAVTETQANVDDLDKQYTAAKAQYEEAMGKVAEFNKAE